MNYSEGEVPYIIIAQTKEKPEDKCEEKGNLIIKAFYGPPIEFWKSSK